MATASAAERVEVPAAAARRGLRLRALPAPARACGRELLILLSFTLMTGVMTWPWVTRLRDAVVDPGDPYLISWILWWDYHQTFRDPLHLFDANIFYPLRYTLAFTENDYGIALLFFPLFALGLRPLTVNSVATFLGFAFCGYGAFRLARTLTGSQGAGWVAGVVFAFIPYRFHLLSQLHYVWAGWMPLLLEALVLFARGPTRRRAAWLAVAFVMNGLSCLTWFILALAPLALSALFLVARRGLWRDRAFWVRGAAAAAAATLALLPFLLPYHYVSRDFGFTWGREVVEKNSPTAMHWLMAEYRNRLWKGFGDHVTGGNYRLFPGLLPLLLALAAVWPGAPLRRAPAADASHGGAEDGRAGRWVARLDVVTVAAAVGAFVAAGWEGSAARPWLGALFGVVTADRVLLVAAAALTTRLWLAYPRPVRLVTGEANLREHVRAARRGEAFWIGMIWAVTGFLLSLGTNSWLYRVLYDLVFPFRGMREPSRAAMVACLGLAVLAGVGAQRLARAWAARRPRRGGAAVVVAVVALLLFELHAVPLRFMRGAVYPDELTLRLKETSMRGGLVELPTGGGELPHLYMLRAADHGRPLINAISTFVPPHAAEIDQLARSAPIPRRLLDRLEEVPTSYLVVHTPLIEPSRRPVYEAFLLDGVTRGRLRFIRRYGAGNDLYAVVKNEPEARAEGPLPFALEAREWAALVADDPVHLAGVYTAHSQELYRVLLVARGGLPRYGEFVRAVGGVGRGLLPGSEEWQFRQNLLAFAESLAQSPEFRRDYDALSEADYAARLYANAGLPVGEPELAAAASDLRAGRETRASMLLKVSADPRLVERERDRSLVLIHYFAYLGRNPDDPPDGDLTGFNHWVGEVKKHGGEDLSVTFSRSIEHVERRARAPRAPEQK